MDLFLSEALFLQLKASMEAALKDPKSPNISEWNLLSKLTKNELEMHQKCAMVHFDFSEFTAAEILFTILVKEYKLGPIANKGRLAVCLMFNGQIDKAAALAIEAYTEIPQEPSSYLAMSGCMMKTNRFQEAFHWFELFELACPNFPPYAQYLQLDIVRGEKARKDHIEFARSRINNPHLLERLQDPFVQSIVKVDLAKIDLPALQADPSALEAAYEKNPEVESLFVAMNSHRYLFSEPHAEINEETLRQPNAPIHKLDFGVWCLIASKLAIPENARLIQTCPLYLRWGDKPEYWNDAFASLGSAPDASVPAKKYMRHMRRVIRTIFEAMTALSRAPPADFDFPRDLSNIVYTTLSLHHMYHRPEKVTLDAFFEWLMHLVLDSGDVALADGVLASAAQILLNYVVGGHITSRSRLPFDRACQLFQTLVLAVKDQNLLEAIYSDSLYDISLSADRSPYYSAASLSLLLRSPSLVSEYHPKLVWNRIPTCASPQVLHRAQETLSGVWHLQIIFESLPALQSTVEKGILRLNFSAADESSSLIDPDIISRSMKAGAFPTSESIKGAPKMWSIQMQENWPSFDSMGHFELTDGAVVGNYIYFCRSPVGNSRKLIFRGTAMPFGFGGICAGASDPSGEQPQLHGIWFLFQSGHDTMNTQAYAAQTEAKTMEMLAKRPFLPEQAPFTASERLIGQFKYLCWMYTRATELATRSTELESSFQQIAVYPDPDPSQQRATAARLKDDSDYTHQLRHEVLRRLEVFLHAFRVRIIREFHAPDDANRDLTAILKEAKSLEVAVPPTMRKWAVLLQMTSPYEIVALMLSVLKVSSDDQASQSEDQEEPPLAVLPKESKEKRKRKTMKKSLQGGISTTTILAIVAAATAVAAVGAFSIGRLLSKPKRSE